MFTQEATLLIQSVDSFVAVIKRGEREKAPTPGYSLARYREVIAAVILAFPDLKGTGDYKQVMAKTPYSSYSLLPPNLVVELPF